MTKEEFYRKITSKTMRELVKNALSGKELAKSYLTNPNKKDIDKKIDELTGRATDIFILKLKEKGYLEGKEPTEEEFGKLLKEAIKECFNGEARDNSK
jgi:hypothetical protein